MRVTFHSRSITSRSFRQATGGMKQIWGNNTQNQQCTSGSGLVRASAAKDSVEQPALQEPLSATR